MKETLSYSFKDIFTCAKRAFSMKKITTAMKGIFLALLIYSVLTYIALLISDYGFKDIWSEYHFLPAPFAVSNLFGKILMIIGIVVSACIFLLTATAVARITIKELQGDVFYEGSEGMGFARKNWKSVILSPVGLFGFIVFLLLCAMLVGLIGRIPYAGELLTTPFTIFYFAAALLVVFLGFVLFISLILVPIVVATTEADFFDALFETFNTVIKDFWRFFLYVIITKFMAYVGIAILSFASFLAFIVIGKFCGIGMGDKLVAIGNASLNYLPIWIMNIYHEVTNVLGPLNFWINAIMRSIRSIYSSGDLAWSGHIGAFLAGLSLNIILLFIYSYGFSICTVGYTLTFAVLKKKMDDEDLLEVPEEEEEEILTPTPDIDEETEVAEEEEDEEE